MRWETHIAVSLLLFFSLLLLGIDIKYSILVPLLSVLPDVDLLFGIRYHRKIFHNAWFLLLISLSIFYLTNDFILSLFAGAGILVHLLFDGLTPTGITLFWPFKKGKIKGNIKTGGPIDKFLFYFFLIVTSLIFSLLLIFKYGIVLLSNIYLNIALLWICSLPLIFFLILSMKEVASEIIKFKKQKLKSK